MSQRIYFWYHILLRLPIFKDNDKKENIFWWTETLRNTSDASGPSHFTRKTTFSFPKIGEVLRRKHGPDHIHPYILNRCESVYAMALQSMITSLTNDSIDHSCH